MKSHRQERVAEAIREELAEILVGEAADPRLRDFTVTRVVPSGDLRSVRILVSPVESAKGSSDPQAGQLLKPLERAKGYLRHELAQRLDLRRAPDLHFDLDRGEQGAQRVETLLGRLRKKPNSGLDP